MKNFFLIWLFAGLFFTGCYTVKPVETRLLVNAEIIKINSWVNLMPGSDETFHVTGIIRIINKENSDLDSLNTKVNVIQGDSVIFSLKPEMDPIVDGSKPLRKGEDKEFTFVLEKVLNLRKELNYDIPLKIEFIFHSGSKERTFRTEDVSIEKAY